MPDQGGGQSAAVSRPPIVLVHGAGSSFEHSWVRLGWIGLLESLGYTEIIGAHLPGHGPNASEETAGGGITESVLTVVPGDGEVDVMGFSAGGYAVLTAIARCPSRFRRVALLGVGDAMMANNIAPRIELADSLLRPDGPGRSSARPLRRVIAEAGNNVDLVARHIRTPRPTVTPAELNLVSAEVLVVVGTGDDVGPATMLAAATPGCAVVTPDGLGHHATLSDARSQQAVRAFLERD